MSNPCNFCPRTFKTHQGLSSHYKIHKDLPASQWIENGPLRSKAKTAFLKAQKERARNRQRQSQRHVITIDISSDDDDEIEVLSPKPLRAVQWVGPMAYADLPWLTLNPEPAEELNQIRPPGPPTPFQGPDQTHSHSYSDSDSQEFLLPDLNLPATSA